jgi:hypothetical protein
MSNYRLIETFKSAPGVMEIWIIERTILGGAPVRLQVGGTRKEAEAEVKRLNSLAHANEE